MISKLINMFRKPSPSKPERVLRDLQACLADLGPRNFMSEGFYEQHGGESTLQVIARNNLTKTIEWVKMLKQSPELKTIVITPSYDPELRAKYDTGKHTASEEDKNKKAELREKDELIRQEVEKDLKVSSRLTDDFWLSINKRVEESRARHDASLSPELKNWIKFLFSQTNSKGEHVLPPIDDKNVQFYTKNEQD